MTLGFAYAGYIVLMCYNRKLEKFFVEKMAVVPFLRIPAEWHTQQEAKKGLLPKNLRESTSEITPGQNDMSIREEEKAEKSKLVNPISPSYSDASADTKDKGMLLRRVIEMIIEI